MRLSGCLKLVKVETHPNIRLDACQRLSRRKKGTNGGNSVLGLKSSFVFFGELI